MRSTNQWLGWLAIGLLGACAPESEEALPADNEAAPASALPSSAPPGETTGLKTLSLAEAPASTRTFYWGEAKVEAPGFYSPPDNALTIALDAENHLRYLSWREFSAFPKTFGDGPTDFPLRGTKTVDLRHDYTYVYQGTVDEASVSDASHWLFRMRTESSEGQSDYVEGVEGTRAGDGWAVKYTEKGTYFGAEIDARGEGTLYAGDPKASAPAVGQASAWSAPVELSAPDFYGAPVDHLTVQLGAHGELRSFGFEKFTRAQTFGAEPGAFPLSGTREQGDLKVQVDSAVDATPEHFVIRYHVQQPSQGLDYVEGLDGTRAGSKLTVRYFIKGTLYGATIDAHAAGTLVPSSQH
jgi:hypothetical protein